MKSLENNIAFGSKEEADAYAKLLDLQHYRIDEINNKYKIIPCTDVLLLDDTPIAIGDILYSPIFGKVIVKGICGLKPNERAGYINITLYKWGIHFKTGSIFYSKELHMIHLERKRLSIYDNIKYIVGEANDCTGLSPRLHTLSQIILFSMAVVMIMFMIICMGVILNFLGI